MSLAPWFFSERIQPKNKFGQWIGCRVATICNCVMDATSNEGNLNAKGRPRGRAGRKSLMLKGLRGADGDWRQDAGFSQADVDEIQKAMFPHLPLPELVLTQNFSSLISHLPQERENGTYPRSGHVISIALRLSALPVNDEARRYTAADHQVKLSKRRQRDGVWWVKMTDPMRPQSDTYLGDWVKEASIRKAARAINGGIIIAELYPIGEWTERAIMAQRKDKRIRTLGDQLIELSQALASAEAALEACEQAAESGPVVLELREAIDGAISILSATKE